MNGPSAGLAPRFWTWRTIAFALLMLALTGLFVGLGLWQVQRLGEKQDLIATVGSRMDDTPVQLPEVDDWEEVHWEAWNYRPVTLTGSFHHDQAVLVFTSLGTASGAYSGPGYWVMVPFETAGGGAVFVNRGFVPEASRVAFADGGTGPLGTVTLTGIGRLSEEASAFTPDPDNTARMDWVRDVDRLALMADPELAPFAPIFVDLPGGDAGALPQGGETRVQFPNNHLGYAITWFGFALITPILLVVWMLAQRRRR